jgi:hypothetical protein
LTKITHGARGRFFYQQALAANQIPFLLPGFQQFGEKECGKELSCGSKSAQAAWFGALHTIRCEDE